MGQGTVGLWGLGGGCWHLRPGHKHLRETSQETLLLGVTVPAPAHDKEEGEAGGQSQDRWAQGTGHPAAAREDAPTPGVTAHGHCSPGRNEAAGEKGVN